jgi:integrase
MKIGDLVKAKGAAFHQWNGVIIGWYYDQLEVLVLENKRGTSRVTVPFDPKTMEIVNESR